jgi:hypothetical protein
VIAIAALWLLGLWFAAPLLRGASYGTADRVRDTIAIGVAIPFVLGYLHVLYPLALWIALAACIIGATFRARGFAKKDRPAEPVPYLLVAVLALVVWPALVRPPTEGDTLVYHLPNAAMWSNAHTLWASNTLYWLYPPASEVFASALYTIGGPFGVGWSGTLPLVLLGWRAATYMRERMNAPALFADAAAAAIVTIPPIALQGGTLQNDVWLAAFLLEAVVTESSAASAVLFLIKPTGWLLGAIALASKQSGLKQWLPAGIALALWMAHDELLRANAIVPLGATAVANIWSTSIIMHGPAAVALLVKMLALASPLALAAFVASLAAPFLGKARQPFAFVACACALFYLVSPFGFTNGTDQLANGASLRFAAPAFAFGTIAIVAITQRYWALFAALFAASAAGGALGVVAIFWNDATTRSDLAVAAAAVALAFIVSRVRIPLAAPVCIAAAVAVSSQLAAKDPVSYYAGETASGVLVWIQTHPPTRAVNWGLPGGVINVLSPRTQTYDATDVKDPCILANQERAVLVLAREPGRQDLDAARRARALACGHILYQDALAVVAQPGHS